LRQFSGEKEQFADGLTHGGIEVDESALRERQEMTAGGVGVRSELGDETLP
jgi:hypothetical protein